MKEIAKDTLFPQASGIIEFVYRILKHGGFAVAGFFMARTSLFGGISPLGTALAAGAPVKYLPLTVLGAFAGYLTSADGLGGFRYAAALIAVALIRIILAGTKSITKTPLWCAVTAAAVMTGVGLAAKSGSSAADMGLVVAEGLLAGGGAYFFRRATSVRFGKGSLSEEQAASLLVAINLALTATFAVSFDGISLGRAAAVALILFAARYGRAGAAAVCGISSAAAVCVTGENPNAALVLCFSGLAAGVFSGVGKIAVTLAPMAVSAMWFIISSATDGSVASLAESAVAGTVFFLMPKTVCARLGTFFSPPAVTPDAAGLRRTLTLRLGFASAALHGVSDTVEDVARCLAISKKPCFSAVLHDVENDACKGCSFMMNCWEKQRKVTVDAVLGMSEAVRTGKPISLAEIPEEFAGKCLRIERFEDAVMRHYTDFCGKIAAEKRVTEMREVVFDQMNGIAGMLGELSEEFRTAQNYDIAMAGRVASALKELNLMAEECSCVVDKYGRLTVEAKMSEVPEVPLNRARILSRLEEVCDRDFEPPEINRIGRRLYITATEKAVLAVEFYVTQFNQGKNRLCGDTCRCFYDGRGHIVSVISDGMGSGGRAAVDSAMTSGLAERLIKAGFGYDCTLNLVNSAMLFKSTDESLATLDISCIDLYTGKTELLKAGAAPTIVRRGGRTGIAECKSLPAGILHEVGFDRANLTLKEHDILIMMSDGVCTDGTDWICAELEAWQGGGAKQLSEHIATSARRRRQDGHDDDITVFAAIIEKAV